MLSDELPRTFDPSVKVTVPVGIGPPEEVTAAVKVTDWPNVDGFSDEVRAVVAVALFTVCDTVPEVLPVKLASPPYVAVTECVPGISVLTVNIDWFELTVAVPSVFAPSLKVIVPVAPPPNCGVTVAVNVTGWL